MPLLPGHDSRRCLSDGAPGRVAFGKTEFAEGFMSSLKTEARVTVSENGPYIVTGGVPLARQTIVTDAEGSSELWQEGPALRVQERYALCRCGHSGRKPFCDGTHAKVGFDGTETASREPYRVQANLYDGPVLALYDAEQLCAFGRFCDPHGKVWNQVEQTNTPDVRAQFLRQVANCPAGRLVALDKATGNAIEPELSVSIGLVEDPAEGCSGPLWLRGGIAVTSSDGFAYEVRNRVTLCRCGESKNKPFCDGTHAAIKFKAE
jgi:CDGSH-type Zn-finger protein